MISGAAVDEKTCLVILLSFAGVGFLLGAITWPSVGAGRWNTVMAARVARDWPGSRSVGTGGSPLSRGAFFSLMFAAFPLLKGWCRGFLVQHVLWAVAFVLCTLSIGIWFLAAATLQAALETERKKRIEAFIASTPGAEPPGRAHEAGSFPVWLRFWEWINWALFSLLVGSLLRGLATLAQ